jgi:uncharacterized membrane protein YbhN (UPF0104 family)
VGRKTKRIIKTILKFGLTIAALYYVFSRIEFSSVMDLFGQTRVPFLLLAVLLFAASKALSAIRLNIFFRKIGLEMPEKTNLRLYLLGMFYNLFLPGGIGGDGYKIYLLQKKYKTGTARLFGAVLSDRLSGMSALAILAALLFSVIDIPLQWNIAGVLLIPVIIAGMYLFFYWFYRHFLPVHTKTTFYSLGVQLLQLCSAWMILLALGGAEGFELQYLFVFLVSSIVAVLPISVGGMGVRELTFLYGAQFLGIDQDLAVGISLMFYLITALVSFLGIWFVARPGDVGIQKSEIRSLKSDI